MMNGLIFTNDNCISCNKCVRVCTSPGASYVDADGSSSVVRINPDRCISCGACFDMCEHNARDFYDDTEAFFQALKRGEPITLLIAPAFRAAYPEEYGAILGGLKALGVRRVISVAFGADICTWAYLKYIRENHFHGGISTPCPVAVSYVEHCLPELIPRLIPVQSPLVCAAIYCREQLGITDKIAFLGPCIAKKLETDAFGDTPVHYSLTFLKLMDYVRRNQVYGPDAADEIEYGLGSFYPAPGGLAENVRWFLGDDTPIRIVSGKTYLFGWLRTNSKNLEEQNTPFLMIDALHCQEGCIEGTATEGRRFEEDRILSTIQKIRSECKSDRADSPWNPLLSPAERLERLNEQFQDLSLSHYLRRFVDRSQSCEQRLPSEEEADRIFNEMLKHTPESRRINCSACGYNTCYDMMVAIHNGFNSRQNCIHYEKNLALAAAEEATRANLSKSRFLSRMSHEIRTPINAIIGLDTIALRNEDISQRTRDELKKIGASSQHLLSIVNDILEMSSIESGHVEINTEPFSLRGLLDQICVIALSQCQTKGLQFISSSPEISDLSLAGDSVKLKQVIFNIISNAVKFTDPPGEITFTVAQTELPDSRVQVRFTVSDTGIGMDRAFLPKIFETFSQEDTNNTTRYGGSGLGMAITRSFVELMGGEIGVESEKGHGTTFTVTVPLEREKRAEETDSAADAGSLPAETLEGKHILIAEDLELNAEILADLLDLEGMTSEWAEDGQQAVELFSKSEPGHFDAILMDIRMPVMDGLEATRAIRSLNHPDAATIPIIAVTANAFDEDVRDCISSGMNEHLPKPADIDLLTETLSRYLLP